MGQVLDNATTWVKMAHFKSQAQANLWIDPVGGSRFGMWGQWTNTAFHGQLRFPHVMVCACAIGRKHINYFGSNSLKTSLSATWPSLQGGSAWQDQLDKQKMSPVTDRL